MAPVGAPVSDTELSKDVENPVTRRITLPLRYEALRPAGGLHKGSMKARGVRGRRQQQSARSADHPAATTGPDSLC
jgi:hypothetical protein